MKYILTGLFLINFLIISSVSAERPKGIDWFNGTVEQAFEYAKRKNTPLFLYWGAVWCPPCNQIKKNIYSDKSFQEISKKFVTVYLDGDEKGAQIWSQKLKAKGYPTMMILNPLGREIMRLPTGISAENYVSIMNLSLKKLRSIEDIIKDAYKKRATDEEFEILAYHSWEDETIDFKKLFDNTPASLKHARARFFFKSLKTITDTPTNFTSLLEAILKDPSIVRQNLEELFFESRDIITKIYPQKNSSRTAAIDLFLKAMNEVEKDKKLSLDEQTSALMPLIELYDIDDNKLGFSTEIKSRIQKRVERTDIEAKDPYSRQAAMSTAIDLLIESKQLAEARKYATKELKKSHSPYYFMRLLAKIEKDSGNKTEALKWHEQAWKLSKGHATRFEWGTAYLLDILELAPDNLELISSVTKKALIEMFPASDAFNGRIEGRLTKINKKLSEWNNDDSKEAFLTQIRKDLVKDCDISPAREKCANWVKNLGGH